MEKVLQGAIDSLADPYTKATKLPPRDAEKLFVAAADACKKSTYRQILCWGCTPLFSGMLSNTFALITKETLCCPEPKT